MTAAGNVCRLDQHTGEILWRMDSDSLVACEGRYLLLKAPGFGPESRKPYRLVDPDGQVLLDFDPDPEKRYSFLHWAVSSDGQIAALGSPAQSQDSLLLFLLEKDTGEIRHVVPLDVAAASVEEGTGITCQFSLFLTRELALVAHQTDDWNQNDLRQEASPSLSRVSAWRLDQGTQAWSWQTDTLAGTPEIYADEEHQRLAVYAETGEVISVLSLRDGQLISKAALPGSLCAVAPCAAPAGEWGLRALLFDGTILQIDPADGFSWVFSTAAGNVELADMCMQAEKIAVAAAALNAPQNLVLIGRISNPDSRVLVPDADASAVAVRPDGTILIALQNEADSRATDLRFLNPDGTEAREAVTIPDLLYASLLGFTPDGKQVAFGSTGSASAPGVLVRPEDGSVTRVNQAGKTTFYLSPPGKNIWNADFDFSDQKLRIFREEQLLWDQPLPERMRQPLTAAIGGCGWLSVYLPDSEGSGRILLCNLEAGSWQPLPDAAPRSAPILCCGNRQKRLALADAESISVYGESLNLVYRLPHPVERNAIELISFSADDELLCLGLTGNRFCLLRLSDGLGSAIITCDSPFSEIRAEKTARGDYAVSFRRSGTGLGFLIREDSLKIRARIPGLLAVLPGTDLVLRNGEMSQVERLFISPVYSLEELLEMADSRFR